MACWNAVFADSSLAANVRIDGGRSSPQCDVELMTEKEVLSLKPAPRLE
jgi:hypothetical protein